MKTDKIKGAIPEAIEALEASVYALDRAICFKHPSSSQKEVEQKSLALAQQALEGLKAYRDAMPDDLDYGISQYGYLASNAKAINAIKDAAKLTAEVMKDE